MTIKKGDILTIKPQYRDAGDERFTWVARSDEEKGRLDISALEQRHWPIWPMQTVSVDMVELPIDARCIAQLDGLWLVLTDEDTKVSFDNAISVHRTLEAAERELSK